MKKLTSKEIRNLWIDFFKSKNHKYIESASLIPKNDKSLLWINSGVATLKDYFSGKKMPPSNRLVNSQRCIRTNDIDNVGVTSRHQTLFEMLGNFSIGDYQKEEAIEFGFEFLFDILKMDINKIYITYHVDDKITYDKWISLGINKANMILGNDKTNFWDLGLGPCGPCTEIFFDRGEKFDPEKTGLKLLEQDLENDRYIEIWNIVFSELNNDGNGNRKPLKQKNIDTGAGLERIVSIFQDTPTNFETDLFLPLINEIEKLTPSFKYKTDNYFIKNKEQEVINKNFRVVADHVRATTLSINDGAFPSNTSRGYIIRRLIRRAYRAGKKLGIEETTFLNNLVEKVFSILDIKSENINKIKTIIKKEEELFAKTINQGEEILLKEISKTKNISSEFIFKLFETYGYPIELTAEIIEQNNATADLSDIEKLRKEHSEKSKSNTAVGMDSQLELLSAYNELVSTFTGYTETSTNSNLISCLNENGLYYSIFEKTPFYATSGGQKHDYGTINGTEVLNVFKDKFKNHWHVTNEKIKDGVAELIVNPETRNLSARNHTGTHLLGAAVLAVLGEARQLGSENNSNKLRLDFPVSERPTSKQIQMIEDKVNEYIKEKYKREYIITTNEEAIKMGALALEDETYEDPVRIVDLVISKEFCGGTHVDHTGELEVFQITKVESKGAGRMRIEGMTTISTVDEYNEKEYKKYNEIFISLLNKNKKIDNSYSLEKPASLKPLIESLDKLKNDFKGLLKKQSNIEIDTSNITFRDFNGMDTYINLKYDNPSIIKKTAVTLREKFPDKLIIIGALNGPRQMVAVTSTTYDSNKILQDILSKNNGKGGGQEQFAMGSCDPIKEIQWEK